ncbi:MAG: holo-[acyl-carrier-protein] synthase [Candidatus Anoxymicrobium japonicum]|uniref:Holo-[acyl-carrier-protein] synthase n=1 Tax=Candidatus Anoxymicrobium japonicum TaxID=2013648 RepID=A0A2N3G566_9ACTN|nr:MAG: holo-[acyl-carrier-protein] synthase [Candidatus Anoxymicrobium japonicum]
MDHAGNIAGIGVDIVSVERIRVAAERSKAFLTRNFSDAELTYCLSQKEKYQHLAARFAAKEAVAKALGAGMKPTQVEVVHGPGGAPLARLSGTLQREHPDKRLFLSLSHDGEYAVAFCVAA